MEHRHLLPEELEEILDAEAIEATSGMRDHLGECEQCRSELARLTELNRALDHLPHHGPAPLFAYRVMSQVQVFEPWHVALRDSVRRLVPRTTAARWIAGFAAVLVASVITVAGAWTALNSESAWLFAEVGVKRVRAGLLSGVKEVLESVFGRNALSAIEGTGSTGSVIAISVAVGVILVAAVGFRAAAIASRRRRS